MSEDALAKMVETAKARALSVTPEQRAERARIDARNTALQELGMAKRLPQPKSGTWGARPKP
jgi:hypothetical protein